VHRYINYAPIALVVLFVLYRRIRRTVGFQRLNRAQIWVQTGMFAVVCAIILHSDAFPSATLAADAAGIAIGVTLAVVALRKTLIEERGANVYFRPHPWIGLLVALLFIVRLAYRFLVLRAGHGGNAMAGLAPHLQFQTYAQDPVTAGVYFLLAAYWGTFNVWLLRRGRVAAARVPFCGGHCPGAPSAPRALGAEGRGLDAGGWMPGAGGAKH